EAAALAALEQVTRMLADAHGPLSQAHGQLVDAGGRQADDLERAAAEVHERGSADGGRARAATEPALDELQVAAERDRQLLHARRARVLLGRHGQARPAARRA